MDLKSKQHGILQREGTQLLNHVQRARARRKERTKAPQRESGKLRRLKTKMQELSIDDLKRLVEMTK